MGSVISYETCPKCDLEEGMSVDFYYKSDEEYRFCNRCGYSYTREITNREDSDKDEDWKPKYKEKRSKGIGCFKYGSGVLSCGHYTNKKFRKELEEDVKKYNSKNSEKIKTAEYTFKDKGEWFIKDVITGETRPFPTMNEYYKEKVEE